MTKSVADMMKEARVLDAALKQQGEKALVAAILDRLTDEDFTDALADLSRLAMALPPSQVGNVIASLLATHNACVQQTQIRAHEIKVEAGEAQA